MRPSGCSAFYGVNPNLKKVNGWDSLIVDTKISILVALGVLDSPLCEIIMSKLNKQHISPIGYH